jgi:hypothetical protein
MKNMPNYVGMEKARKEEEAKVKAGETPHTSTRIIIKVTVQFQLP